MKLTTPAVLAFAAASVLGSPVSFKDTAVYARDLYERDSSAGFLESSEKRKGGSLKPGLSKSIFGAFGTMGGRVASSASQLTILKKMIPPAPPPAPIPPPAIHLKRRDLSSPIAHLELLEKRRRRGGADKTPSLLKAVSGAVGTMGGRVASGGAQLEILKKMIPPAPPPPPPSQSSASPQPPSPSPSPSPPPSPLPSPPLSHPKSPLPAPLQPSAPQSPFIPPAVPPFPHFPPQVPPAVPHPSVRRRSLSRPIDRLQTFEKRSRGGADQTASMFKFVSGADGTMGGRSAQLGILKTMIPPAPSVRRRDLSRPVARAFFPGPAIPNPLGVAPVVPGQAITSPLTRISTGGGQAIKNAFSRFSKASVKFHNSTAPARKKGKNAIIALFEGLAKGIAV